MNRTHPTVSPPAPTASATSSQEGKPVYLPLPRIPLRLLRRYSAIPERDRRRVLGAIKQLRARPDAPQIARMVAAITPALYGARKITLATALEIGQWLLDVKDAVAVEPGTFSTLFAEAKGSLDAPIPMTIKMAQIYMRVASHPAVRDDKIWTRLPAESLSTVDLIFRLAPDQPTLARLIVEGRVHPKMTRADVEKLRTELRAGRGGHRAGLEPDPVEKLRRGIVAVLRDPAQRKRLMDLLREVFREVELDARYETADAEQPNVPIESRPAPEWMDEDEGIDDLDEPEEETR